MIKYLVMDVDGTLTDGKVYIGNDGEVMKAFSIKDGCGIREILMPAGIIPAIITGRKSKIVENRCAELGITEIYQGEHDKVSRLLAILEQAGATLAQTAYVGDDLNDLACMKLIRHNGGVVGCPADAAREVREIANYVCAAKGGDGAVREFIEWLVRD